MDPEKNLEKIPQPEKAPEKPEEDREKSAIEKKHEKTQEKKDEADDKNINDEVSKTSDKEIKSEDQERSKQIDTILSHGLNDIFLTLSAEKQEEFKNKGEETRDKINQLLTKTKVSIGKVVVLIKKWLSLIPQVNKYFLEKEAKIKADKIIKLKKY